MKSLSYTEMLYFQAFHQRRQPDLNRRIRVLQALLLALEPCICKGLRGINAPVHCMYIV